MKQNRKTIFLISVVVLGVTILLATLVKFYYHNRGPNISFYNWIETKPIIEKNHTFRFAIASMVSAEETWTIYRKLVDYVASRIGEKTSMILRPSYSDIRILLREKEVDVAFVCTGTYIKCSRAGIIELIAVPEFKDDAKYRCLFIVNSDSKINDMADLKNKVFAFTDPESNTGCVVPTWIINKYVKNAPEAYFSKIIYTGSHDRSLHAVAKGLVDGAGVDSLVFYSFIENHPEMKEFLRVIWESEPFGAPPIVVPAGLSKSIKEQLGEIFLSMSQDARGREILDGIGIKRFRVPEPDEYKLAREIWYIVYDTE